LGKNNFLNTTLYSEDEVGFSSTSSGQLTDITSTSWTPSSTAAYKKAPRHLTAGTLATKHFLPPARVREMLGKARVPEFRWNAQTLNSKL
jgi:hypothetical protein